MGTKLKGVIKRSLPYWIMSFLCIPVAFIFSPSVDWTFAWLGIGGVLCALPILNEHSRKLIKSQKNSKESKK